MRRALTVAALTGLLAGAYFYRPVLPSLCTMKIVTGIGCPGCGMTRSVIASTHGRFREAIQWHALGPLVLTSMVGLLIATILGFRVPWSHPWTLRVLIGFVGVLFVYWVVRLFQGTVP